MHSINPKMKSSQRRGDKVRLCSPLVLVLAGTVLFLALLCPHSASAEKVDIEKEIRDTSWITPISDLSLASLPAEDEELKWFVFIQLVNAYPNLESEQLIESIFNPIMHFLAPSYDDVTTVKTLRDNNMLLVPQFGFGRILSDRWTVYLQAGYSAGKVRTIADDRSIFLLPLHTDLEIARSAFSTTLGADFYPLGMVKLKKYDSIWERVRGAKPKLGTSVTGTYASFDARIKVGFHPVPYLVDVKISDAWYVPSINANLGIDFPIGKKTTFVVGGGYNFFDYKKEDFGGSSFTATLNYFFK